MPFKSQAQRAYLFIHEPKVAKEFAAHTPKGAKLPQHITKTKDRALKNGYRKSYK